MKQQYLKMRPGGFATLLMLIILITASCFSYGQENTNPVAMDSIIFIEGRSNTAFKKAAQKGGYVFVDLQAKWCGPCKVLKAKVFTDKKVAGYFNSHFVNLSIDVEKGEGPELARKWHIEGCCFKQHI